MFNIEETLVEDKTEYKQIDKPRTEGILFSDKQCSNLCMGNL